MAMNDARMWSVPELAKAAQVHEQTVRLDIERKVLPATRHAGRFAISDAEAKGYVDYREKIRSAQAVLDSVRATTKERKERRDDRSKPDPE